jgi:hypothetical protein
MLQKHAQCKSEDPTGTSALVVVPQAVHPQCTPLLANMFCLGQHKIYQNGPNTWLYRDDPQATPGVKVADQLPEAIKVLRAGELYSAPDLTFVFGAKVAGQGNFTALCIVGQSPDPLKGSFLRQILAQTTLTLRPCCVLCNSRITFLI